jgi:hypothetical protein
LRLIFIYTTAANRSVDFLSRKQPMGASVTLRRFFHSRTLGRGATRGLLFWQGKDCPPRGGPSRGTACRNSSLSLTPADSR